MSDTLSTSHTIANVECTGVFWKQIYESRPYHNAPKYMSCSGDFHLFLLCGEKVYVEIYEYTGNRVWSLDTAYIDLDIDKTNNKNYKIIPSGNVVYYKVNPIDLDKMEYTSRQGLELFRKIYICRRDNI